jgi:hypothetical protein
VAAVHRGEAQDEPPSGVLPILPGSAQFPRRRHQKQDAEAQVWYRLPDHREPNVLIDWRPAQRKLITTFSVWTPMIFRPFAECGREQPQSLRYANNDANFSFATLLSTFGGSFRVSMIPVVAPRKRPERIRAASDAPDRHPAAGARAVKP